MVPQDLAVIGEVAGSWEVLMELAQSSTAGARERTFVLCEFNPLSFGELRTWASL
jgi:hypothetical protein